MAITTNTSYLFILMVLNGVAFFPPSEYLYLAAFLESNGVYSELFILLSLFNAVGHIILYAVVRRWSLWSYTKKKLSARGDFMSKFIVTLLEKTVRKSESLLISHDHALWIVAYGRCIPIVHTGISIVAAERKMPIGRFVLLTVSGNAVFSQFWFLVFYIVDNDSSWWYLGVFGTIIIMIIYFIHRFMEKALGRSKLRSPKNNRLND